MILTQPQYTFNESDARQFYKWLRHGTGEFTEVRVIEWNPESKGRSTQFFVTNEEDFIKVCQTWNGKRQVYAGINPRVREGGTAEDVKHITGFPFDIDGPTPDKRKQAATELEVKVAESWKNDLVNLIKQQFGIEPYIDFSGNGYRVCLPCDITVTNQEEIDAKLKLFFTEYKEKLKLPEFDNISDLPRIIKVPGVWSLKGVPTEERPHRQAKLIQLGETSKIQEFSNYILSLKDAEPETKIEPEKQQPQSNLTIPGIDTIKLRKLRHCFANFIIVPERRRMSINKDIETRNSETGLRKALVKELYFNMYNKEEILEICKKFDDYNYEKSEKEVNNVLNTIEKDPEHKKIKPWTCKSIHKNGGCLGEVCPSYNRKILKKIEPTTPVLAPKEIEPLYEEITLQPLTDDELKETLGSTVKHDDNNKIITFLSLLCTYTEADQINIGYLAESSSGKSYIPLELSCYFPDQDVIALGYCSPTAFFHEWGTLIPDSTDHRDVEPDKKHKIRLVDLERILLIFLDQPHAKLLENLRPLLSHDKKEIRLKITNKSEKSGQRSENIIVRGYPTVVFCTANYKQNEQEKTRLLLLSPEHTQEKIREAIMLKIEKESDRETFAKTLATDPKRQALIQRVKAIRQAKIKQIIIPTELREIIYQNFMEKRTFLQSRNSRDVSRLLNIIKGNAILNYQQRNPVENEDTDTTITATQEDIEIGFKYYGTVSEANELGIPPEVYEVFNTFKIEMADSETYPNGFSRKEFQEIYFRIHHRYVGRGKAKDLIESMEAAGLIIEQPDPIDKRTTRYVCERGGVSSAISKFNLDCITKELKEKIFACWKKYSIPHPPRTHIFCADVCKNFTTRFCTASNPFYRSENAEMPLKCPGFKTTEEGS
jgi:hypothetical protein